MKSIDRPLLAFSPNINKSNGEFFLCGFHPFLIAASKNKPKQLLLVIDINIMRRFLFALLT